MKKILGLAVLLSFCWCLTVVAANPPPLALAQKVSNNVLRELRQHRGHLNNKTVVHKIVTRNIVPNVDLPGVARSVVGRNYWYQSSPKTRQQFIKVLTDYVIDMYSSAFAAFTEEKITFRPMRSYNSSQKRALIYSHIIRPGVAPLSLNYRLIKKGSAWKIYDFSIDGVSMVQSYRAQFASTLKQGGLPKLIQELKNR